MLDSINKEDSLIDYALELNLNGLAITDHEAIGGHIKALQYFKKITEKAKKIIDNSENESSEKIDWARRVLKFKLGLGNEIYLCRDNLNKHNYIKGQDGFFHFILVAKDEIGHHQIRKLSSLAWSHSFRQFMERVPTYYSDIEDVVLKDKGHIIATTACLGGQFPKLLTEAIQINNFSIVDNFINWCKEIFDSDFYIEIQPGLSKEQVSFNVAAVQYAKNHGVKFIVSTDSHYLKEKDRPIHKSFLNSGDGDREVDDFYAYTYMMSYEEIHQKLSTHLDKNDVDLALINTFDIYNKITNYDLGKIQSIPRVPLDWTGIEKINTPLNGYTYINKFISSEEDNQLYISKIIKGLKEKGIYDKKHLDRVEIELKQIWKISKQQNENLSNYFLTMEKVINIIWDSDSIVGDGRGSAATHLCSYCLNIIQYDPLESPIELPWWRFLSSERPELPDIDTDFEASKRTQVISNITKYFRSIGGDVVPVCTYGTETSKAALQTAARGLGYEPELGTYLSSLVPIDRGFVRSLKQCYFGDEEKGYVPIQQFITEMNLHKDIWEVAVGIEGLISRRGRHACGVLIVNGDYTNFGATMRAPDGGVTTQYELHDAEYCGSLKYDYLTTDFLDRIHVCLNLLKEYNKIEWQGSLRETYNKYLSPKVLNYFEPEMWKLVGENKIQSLFQFDTPTGLQTAKKIKPASLSELAQANSLMRLMPEKGEETPTDIYIRNKNNMNYFYQEIDNLAITEEERNAFMDILEPLYGVADGQEAVMKLLMHPHLFNFSIKEAHSARKLIAKKKIKEISSYRENLYKIAEEKNISRDAVWYLWDVQTKRQLGYSFSYPHTISYSIIAVQALNLAYFYPIIYWNTACLIVDSGGLENNLKEIEDEEESEILLEEDDEEIIEEESEEDKDEVKKKKRVINYGKISSAIGKMRQSGIKIVPPDINYSNFTFVPNEEKNQIIYGIKGITKINDEMAEKIINHRPYSSLEDFLSKVKTTKLQTINLIKSGAFDNVSEKTREDIMFDYISSIAGCKKKLTLQNMQMIINQNLIPEDLKFLEKVYNFNKFLKTCKEGNNYCLDDYSQEYYNNNFDSDLLFFEDGKCLINQKTWEKIYKKEMEKIRPFLSNPETLKRLNHNLIKDLLDKYCDGPVSKWEMDSIGFYNGAHELDGIEEDRYGIVDFFSLPEEPIVQTSFTTKDGKNIPIFKIDRIAGTILEKNKLKNIVTLLTKEGVVKVKIFKPQFVKYDKQIFEKDPVTGKKKVLEKSWFTRGNKLIISGIRRDNDFIPKCYKNSPYPNAIGLIKEIDYNTGELKIVYERCD